MNTFLTIFKEKKIYIPLLVNGVLILTLFFFVVLKVNSTQTMVSPDLSSWQSRYTIFQDGTWSANSTIFSPDENGENEIDLIYGPYIALSKGTYSVLISYSGEDIQTYEIHSYENDAAIIIDGQTILYPEKQTSKCRFSLSEAVNDLEVRVHYNGNGSIAIQNICIMADNYQQRMVAGYAIGLLIVISLILIIKRVRELKPAENESRTQTDRDRLTYFDSIKAIAVIWVFITHYVSIICPQYFDLWDTRPYSYILFGITGKLAVAALGNLMCMFAFRSSEENAFRYIISRYLYFVMAGMLINILYIAFGIYSSPISIPELLRVSLLMEDDLFPTFWCMRPFFAASVLAYLNGRNKSGIILIITQILLLWAMGCDWTSICMMGCLILPLDNNPQIKSLFRSRIIRMIILVAIFVLQKRPENTLTYYIYGITSLLFLIIVINSLTMQRVFQAPRLLGRIGKYTMSIFLIHSFVLKTFGKAALSLLGEGKIHLLIVLITSLAMIIVFAIILQELLNLWNRLVKESLTKRHHQEVPD